MIDGGAVWVGVIVTGVAVLVVLAVVRQRRRLVVVSVSGDSMRPAYAPAERVLVRRVDLRHVRAGQVVVFASPPAAGGDGRTGTARLKGGEWLIKRAGAVPGDPVPDAVRQVVGSDGNGRVPPDHLVVLGDNPGRSTDSRHWGLLPAAYLLGVVLRRLP